MLAVLELRSKLVVVLELLVGVADSGMAWPKPFLAGGAYGVTMAMSAPTRIGNDFTTASGMCG